MIDWQRLTPAEDLLVWQMRKGNLRWDDIACVILAKRKAAS